MTDTGFIYKVTNIINNKIYIGQTTRKLSERMSCHFSDAKNKTDNYKFHNAIRKYGKENFLSEIIEKCNILILDEREIFWINNFLSNINGYNMNTGGSGLNNPSENTRKRIGISSSIRNRGSGNPNFGQIASKEKLNKMSSSLIGREITDNTKQKMSKVRKGKPTWNKGLKGSYKRMNKETVISIKGMLNEGYLPKDISKLFKISETTVRNIRSGKSWKNL